jgi:hypothetical protein
MTKPVRIDRGAAHRTTREGVTPMMNSQLLFTSEYAARFDARLVPLPEAPPESLLRRLIVSIGRRLRPNPPPPYLNDHLCRDIGIEPMPMRQEPPWPW